MVIMSHTSAGDMCQEFWNM